MKDNDKQEMNELINEDILKDKVLEEPVVSETVVEVFEELEIPESFENIYSARIEEFTIGDTVLVAYLREEDLEEVHVIGKVLKVRSGSNSNLFFKIGFADEIVLGFNTDSPFIANVAVLKKGTRNEYRR